jgi:hypothetical protein
MGALALGMSEVPAPDISRMGLDVHTGNRSGPGASTIRSAGKISRIMPQYGRFPSNRYASCSAAGKTAFPATKPDIYQRQESVSMQHQRKAQKEGLWKLL